MKTNEYKIGTKYSKVIFVVFIIFILCNNLKGQSNNCLTRIHLEIETGKGFPDVNNFEILFKIDDSTFRFKDGDSICVDFGKSKDCIVYFYYHKRLISCPIKLEYPLDFTMFIRYYPVEMLKVANNNDFKSLGFKENDSRQILYAGEKLSEETVLVEIPKYFWNRKELKISELFYGIVRISAGRTYFSFDTKPMYQAL